jgi:RNA polymerase sigma-70 factor (ECF subfamily)
MQALACIMESLIQQRRLPVSAEAPALKPEAYRAYLRVLARTLLHSPGPLRGKVDASDIVQDTLLQAHLAFEQFRGGTRQELAAWLRRILANKLADAARHYGRAKRDAALEQSYVEQLDESTARLLKLVPSDDTSPSQRVLRLERLRLLSDALNELPEDQQTAVVLHHLGGYTVVETSLEMGRSTASVAGLLRRGLKGLRVRLQHLEAELD